MLAKARRAARWLSAGDPLVGACQLLLVAYYCYTPGVFQGKHSGDGYFAFAYLRAIVYGHTLDMQAYLPEWRPYFGVDVVTRHMPNRNPIGPVFFWMPFYLVACGVGRVVEAVSRLKVSPGSVFHAWMSGLGTLTLALAACRQLYLLLERHFGVNAARLGLYAVVWATPLAWYATIQPLYQHGIAVGLTVMFVEYWERTRGEARWRRFVWLGVLGGLAADVRAQEVLFLLLPGLEILWRLARPGERATRARWFAGGVTLALSAALAFLPQLLVWRYYSGGWRTSQVDLPRWSDPWIVVTLFSTRGGLFPWSPVVYASALGVLWYGWRRGLRAWVLPLLVVFALDVYVCSCVWVLTGGYAFGARRLSDGAALFGVGVALLFARARGRAARWALVAFVGLCVWLSCATMGWQRIGRTRSSGAMARPFAEFLREANLPSWLPHACRRIGYPFVQPAGWIFAAYHHAPVTAFEGIVGMRFLEREGIWKTLVPEMRQLALTDETRSFIMSGLETRPAIRREMATVTGPIRILMPFFASERVEIIVKGQVALAAPVKARWNGAEATVERRGVDPVVVLTAAQVHSGTNELILELPVGTRLQVLQLASFAAAP